METQNNVEAILNGNLFKKVLHEGSSRSKHLFWDIDPLTLDADKHSGFIIERILRFGLPEDIKAMLERYNDETIRSVVCHSRNIDRKTASF